MQLIVHRSSLLSEQPTVTCWSALVPKFVEPLKSMFKTVRLSFGIVSCLASSIIIHLVLKFVEPLKTMFKMTCLSLGIVSCLGKLVFSVNENKKVQMNVSLTTLFFKKHKLNWVVKKHIEKCPSFSQLPSV
jgi:hypothetical protein